MLFMVEGLTIAHETWVKEIKNDLMSDDLYSAKKLTEGEELKGSIACYISRRK